MNRRVLNPVWGFPATSPSLPAAQQGLAKSVNITSLCCPFCKKHFPRCPPPRGVGDGGPGKPGEVGQREDENSGQSRRFQQDPHPCLAQTQPRRPLQPKAWPSEGQHVVRLRSGRWEEVVTSLTLSLSSRPLLCPSLLAFAIC